MPSFAFMTREIGSFAGGRKIVRFWSKAKEIVGIIHAHVTTGI
jgi:hypothetical protein